MPSVGRGISSTSGSGARTSPIPLGLADDQHVAWYRLYDSGDTPFVSNWDAGNSQPRWMFDPRPQRHARAALGGHRRAGAATPTRPYYLSADAAVPFDPAHAWREGDVIPGQVLREPSGSRAEIRVQGQGRWADGYWDVTLVRALDTGHPLEDKVLRDQGVYSIALSVHRDARASRWHYVSLPVAGGPRAPGRRSWRRASPGTAPDWSRIERARGHAVLSGPSELAVPDQREARRLQVHRERCAGEVPAQGVAARLVRRRDRVRTRRYADSGG